MFRFSMVSLLCVSLLCVSLVGCGQGNATGSVSGVIKVDGVPLDNASVTFTPVATAGQAVSSSGRTDASGSYKLSVTATGEDGAVLGTHNVTVAFIGQETDSDIRVPTAKDPVPPHNLTFEVKSSSNQADFDLKSKSRR